MDTSKSPVSWLIFRGFVQQSEPNRKSPMNALTTSERRGMQAISTADGNMLIVAADQRNGMKAAIPDAPNGSSAITKDELAEVKADLVRHLANHAPVNRSEEHTSDPQS